MSCINLRMLLYIFQVPNTYIGFDFNNMEMNLLTSLYPQNDSTIQNQETICQALFIDCNKTKVPQSLQTGSEKVSSTIFELNIT